MSASCNSLDKRIGQAFALLLAAPVLMVPQVMKVVDFTPDKSADQMNEGREFGLQLVGWPSSDNVNKDDGDDDDYAITATKGEVGKHQRQKATKLKSTISLDMNATIK